jgi:ureidoglycolate hydrolase
MIAEPLTREAFRPFGRVIARPEEPADASGAGWDWWGEAGVLTGDGRGYALGYLDLVPTELTFDWAERHDRTTETILPLGGACVVYVASPADAPAGFRAFRVQLGQGVVLDRGVWHGAPFALHGPLAAAVLLARGTAAQDTVVSRFPDNPLRIEV